MPEKRFPLRAASLKELNDLAAGTMAEVLGIEFIEATSVRLVARMPVDARTKQPFGLLHGGASVALAETMGSIGAVLALADQHASRCVGLEINANHLSSVRSGWVTGRAAPLHVGRSTQVWEIRIEQDDGRLVCVSRLTVAVVPSRDQTNNQNNKSTNQ